MFCTAEYEHTELVEQFTPGVLFMYTSSSFLNGYINLVKPWKAWLLERYTTQGPKYEAEVLTPFLAGKPCHAKLHDLQDDLFVLAETKQWWWVFWFDCDVSDCSIGRVARAYEAAPAPKLVRFNPDGSPCTDPDPTREGLERQLQQERSAGYRGSEPHNQYTREQVEAWALAYLDNLVDPKTKQRRLDNLAEWDNVDANWEGISGFRELPASKLQGWVQF